MKIMPQYGSRSNDRESGRHPNCCLTSITRTGPSSKSGVHGVRPLRIQANLGLVTCIVSVCTTEYRIGVIRINGFPGLRLRCRLCFSQVRRGYELNFVNNRVSLEFPASLHYYLDTVVAILIFGNLPNHVRNWVYESSVEEFDLLIQVVPT